MIYFADSNWLPTQNNPFTCNGEYGVEWSAFIYDESIASFTNVYAGALLYVLRFSPNADKNHTRLFDFLYYESLYKRNVIIKTCAETDTEKLLEPSDYSDYVMLGELQGCGEIVVNSRQKGFVCIKPDDIYTPGARLYFDAEKIINAKIAVRDGLHVLKVKDRLPLEPYLIAVITAEDFPKDTVWTPNLFTKMANELFFSLYI